jgi:hypothetical protein
MNIWMLLLIWVCEYACIGLGYALCFVRSFDDDPLTFGETMHVIWCWPFYVWLDHMESKK